MKMFFLKKKKKKTLKELREENYHATHIYYFSKLKIGMLNFHTEMKYKCTHVELLIMVVETKWLKKKQLLK